MSFPMFSTVVVVFGLFSAFVVSANAQSAADPPSTQQPVYTLHADKRVVLTDVTETDRQGNPIRGLDASVFRISDNGKPQDLASFEEHSGAPVESVPSAATKPGMYSNDFLQHPPPVFNVLLIDLVSIKNLPYQMSLHYELTQFLNHLHELALDLGKLPGRKNVFWFCGDVGGDPFRPDPTTLSGYSDLRPNDARARSGPNRHLSDRRSRSLRPRAYVGRFVV